MRSKKAIYNILTNLMLQIIVIIYGFIIPRIIISNFGSIVNGLISSITQFLIYISLLEAGFGPVVKAVLYKPISNKNKKEIQNILRTSEHFFRTIAIFFIIYIAILCMLYPLIVNSSFSYVYTISLIIIISISTFAEYFFGMAYILFLQAEQKTYVISIIQIITYIISIIVVVMLAQIGANIQMIKLVSGLIFVLRPLLINFYVKKKYHINLKESNEKYNLNQKWDGLAQHIAAVIHGNTDVTILTFFCSLTEISVYSVYYLVVKGVKSVVQAFNSGIDASFGDMIVKKEQDNLNKKFNMYEVIYFTITTIIFSCAIILITPFISVYTKGITDANYIRYTFGYLIVISEYIWAIRLPYSSIILAAGHFKETRIGAWIEAMSNIILSVLLVWKYGIIGVTIGTIVAMTIRTVEFVYHANRYIINRSIMYSFKKIFIIAVETVIIVLISRFIPYFDNISYINWIINSIMTLVLSTIVVLICNTLLYGTDMKLLVQMIKRIFQKNSEKEIL